MKKLWITAMAAALILMSAASVYAYSEDEFSQMPARQAEGFYTQIMDTEGEMHIIDGLISSEEIEEGAYAEKIASYEIFSKGESVMKVTLNDVVSQGEVSLSGADDEPFVNGYYSVRFSLSQEDNTEAFLTGLSDTNVDLVQEEMVNAAIENSQFSMEALDFIDAEKTNLPEDGDDLHCWAATTANMLHYTGWGQKVGFYSPDDIFEEFIAAFDDSGSVIPIGLNWFFNGINDALNYDNYAQVKDYGNSGRYLPQYFANGNYEYSYILEIEEDYKNFIKYFDALDKGYGLGIAIAWMQDGIRVGGHAITLWGYIIDKDFEKTDPQRYTALIVSDSDSDMTEDTNRRVAPNKLSVLNMVPYRDGGINSWYFEGYSGSNNGVLESFTALAPYSDDIEYETDLNATLNPFTDFDFFVNDLWLSNDSLEEGSSPKVFAEGDTIYLMPELANGSALNFPEGRELVYNITVKEKDSGTVIFTEKEAYTGGIEPCNMCSPQNGVRTVIPSSEYEAGVYTVEIEIPKSSDFAESLYYNNKYTCDFRITEASYDLSNARMTVAIGELKDGEMKADISYYGLGNLEELLQGNNAVVGLCLSYYADGKWGAWERAYTGDGSAVGERGAKEAVLPNGCTLFPNGEKVKLRLAVSTDDGETPVFNIYSDELELIYKRFTAEVEDSSARVCTPIESGGKSLADGENIVFRVRDVSTGVSEEALFCNLIIYAVKNEEKIVLQRYDNVSVPRGGASELIEFNSWSAELDGRYSIVASIESDYNAVDCHLSYLIVGKHHAYEVTTDKDVVDEEDGETSLREAVSLLQKSGEDFVITFADNLESVNLNEPIVIEGKVKIDGGGIIIYGGETVQLFKVESGGDLYCRMASLYGGYSKDSGGAVENRGGKVCIENSRMIFCKSGVSGGAVYSDGGNVTLKNCSFKGNTSGYGGAIGAGNSAEIALLNCNLFQNKSNGGAVYNNGGHMTIIYSTVADNSVPENSLLETGGIVSVGTADVFGSVIVHNDGRNLSGKINSYGNYITGADDKVTMMEHNVYGDGYRAFWVDENQNVIWEPTETDELVGYRAKMSGIAENGIYLKNIDGKIAYSADGIDWLTTEVASVFDDSEYSRDMFGNEHGALFGADSKIENEIKITSGGSGYLHVYMPYPQEGVLIEKRETEEQLLSEAKVNELNFDYGTNIIQFKPYDGNDIRSFMLWSSIEEMRPLCEAFVVN